MILCVCVCVCMCVFFYQYFSHCFLFCSICLYIWRKKLLLFLYSSFY
jgi:hypothetical protein